MKTGLRNNLLALTLLCGFSGFTHAVPMLDQENDATGGRGNGFVGGPNLLDRAQTFTVGLAGIMTSFDVQVHRTDIAVDDLIWDIRTLAGGAPTEADVGANILASGTVAAGSVSQVAEDFLSIGGLNLNVAVGDMLAIVLRSTEVDHYRWTANFGVDAYAGGAHFDRFSGFPGQVFEEDTQSFVEVGFRTFVDDGVIINPTPTPATLALFGLALVGLGWSRRTSSKA